MTHLPLPRTQRHWVPVACATLVLLSAPVAIAQPRDSSTRTPRTELTRTVITASGSEQQRRNAPASITVIGRDQLQRQRNNSLAEALMGIEGIDVGGTMGKTGGLTISIRGMPSDYSLILIDGRRQNSAGSITPNGFGETSTSFLPPPSAIERIEIIRGPMATLYGSDAMGGVINIITRRVGTRWTGTVSSDATLQQTEGFGNTFSGNGAVAGPLIENRLGLAVRGSMLDRRASSLAPTGEFGESTVISSRGPSPVAGTVRSVGGRMTWTPSRRQEVSLDIDVARQDYDNANAQLGTLDQPNATPATFNGYGPELRFNRDQFALAHTVRFSRGRLESSLMRNLTATIGRTLPTGTPGGPPGSGVPNKTAGAPRTLESASDVLDSRLVTTFGRHVLTAGGQFWDAEMVDGVALQPFAQTQWSLFAEDQWNLLAPLTLTLGVRRDQHDSFGSQLSPRAYLVWMAAPTLTIKGGVSGGYKTPRLEQLVDGITGFTAQGRTATIGTPGLTPETSVSTEVGVYFERDNGLSSSITLFNNDFNDKIASGTPVPNCTFAGAPDQPGCRTYGSFPTQEFFSQSVNIDKAVTRGVELNARLPLLSRAVLSANYTHTISEQLSGASEGFPLTDTPAHAVNMQLRGDVTRNLRAWITGEHRSARARRLSSATNAAWTALGDFRPYSIVHVGGSYSVRQNVALSATVYNVLNTDFLRFARYQGAVTTANPTGVLYTSLYNNHQEGRRLWLSTTVSF